MSCCRGSGRSDSRGWSVTATGPFWKVWEMLLLLGMKWMGVFYELLVSMSMMVMVG